MYLEFLLLILLEGVSRGDANQTDLEASSYLCDSIDDSGMIYLTQTGSGLDSFVGTNVLQEMLYDSSCSFDSKCFSKYMGTIISAVIRSAVGIITGIVILLAFLFFTPCLCCRCCRRWKGWKRIQESPVAGDFNLKGRRSLLGLTLIVFIAVLVDIGFIAKQKSEVDSGLNTALCEVYKFVNQSVNGGEAVAFDTSLGYSVTAQFPGLYGASEVFANLTDLVAPNSPLSEDLNTLMNQTGIIEGELSWLQQYLNALNSNMQANKMNNYHSCIFCTNFSAYTSSTSQYNPTNPSMLAANNSLAAVLTQIRTQLKPYVGTSSQSSLYNTLNTTATSLSDYADEMTNILFSSVLDQLTLIRDISHYMDVSIIVLLSVTSIPLLLSLLIVIRGLYLSAQDTYTDSNRPPMSPTFVSTSMWFTLLYTFLIFMLSGAVLLAAYLLGSICLLMEDAGSVAAKLSFRFGSAQVSSTVVGITEQCLQQNTDGDILSAIVISGQSTARDSIDSLSTIGSEFEIIQSNIDSGTANTKLAENVYINNLGRYIGEVGDLFVITEQTKRASLLTSNSYKPSSTAAIFKTNYTLGLEVYDDVVYSAPQCPDRVVDGSNTPPGVRAMLSNYTFDSMSNEYSIQGFSSTLSELSSNGVSTGFSTCPTSQTATQNLTPWGNLLTLKKSVMAFNQYQCSVPNVVYNSTTLSYTSSSTRRTCTQSQLATYMSTYGSNLLTQAEKVDDTVDTYFNSIFDSIWSLINDQLMQPIQDLGTTMNCQFISTRWNALFRSLCITFTPSLIQLGNTLYALGFAGVFILLLEIIVWRHLKDNYCHWRDTVKNPERAHHLQARVSGFANIRLSGLWDAWGSIIFSRKSIVASAPPQEQGEIELSADQAGLKDDEDAPGSPIYNSAGQINN